jgi:Cysteine-rich secretory protein family
MSGAAAAFKAAVKLFVLLFAFVCSAAVLRADELSDRVLAEINLARTAPREYAQIVAARPDRSPARDVAEAVHFLEKARPLPALGPCNGLCQSAGLHVADQGPRGGYGHNGSGWGDTPWTRMGKFGQFVGYAGENIYYGHRDARGIVCAWIIDTGVSGKAHRKNIFSPSFGVAGVACGPHASYGAMCVMDFAGSFLERAGTLARL